MLLEAYAAPVVELVDLFEDWATIRISAAPLYHIEGALGNGSRPSRYEISLLCLSVDAQGNPRVPRRSVFVDVQLPSVVVSLTELCRHGVYDVDVRGVTTSVDTLRRGAAHNTHHNNNNIIEAAATGRAARQQPAAPLVGKWARQHLALVPPISIEQGTVEEAALHVVWSFGGWAAPTIAATSELQELDASMGGGGGGVDVTPVGPAANDDNVVSFRNASDRRKHQQPQHGTATTSPSAIISPMTTTAATTPINIVSLFEVEIRRTSSADPTPQVERLAVAFVPGVTPFGGSRKIPVDWHKRPEREGEDAVYVVRVRPFRPHGLACANPGEGQYGSWSPFKRFVCLRALEVSLTDIGINSCRVVWRRRRVGSASRQGKPRGNGGGDCGVPDTVNPAIVDCHLQLWEALRTSDAAKQDAGRRGVPSSVRTVLHTRQVSVEPHQLGGSDEDDDDTANSCGSMVMASLKPDCVYNAQFSFRYADGGDAMGYRWFRFATHAAPRIAPSLTTVGARCIVAAIQWQRHNDDADGNGNCDDDVSAQQSGGRTTSHVNSRTDLIAGFVDSETAEDVIAHNLMVTQAGDDAHRRVGASVRSGFSASGGVQPTYVPVLDDHRGSSMVMVSEAATTRRHRRPTRQGRNSEGEEIVAAHRLSHLIPCVYHIQALHRGIVVSEEFTLHAPSAIAEAVHSKGDLPLLTSATTERSGAVAAAADYRAASVAVWNALTQHPEDRLDALTGDLAASADGGGAALVLLDPLPESSVVTLRVRCGMLSDVALAAFLQQRRQEHHHLPAASCAVDDISALCHFSAWGDEEGYAPAGVAGGALLLQTLTPVDLLVEQRTPTSMTLAFVSESSAAQIRCGGDGTVVGLLHHSKKTQHRSPPMMCHATSLFVCVMAASADNDGGSCSNASGTAGRSDEGADHSRSRRFKRAWTQEGPSYDNATAEVDDDRSSDEVARGGVVQFMCESGQCGRLERMTPSLGVFSVVCTRLDIESFSDARDPLVNVDAPVTVHRVPMLDRRLVRIDHLAPGERYVVAWNAQDACGVWYGGRCTTIATLPMPLQDDGDADGGGGGWEAPGTQHVRSAYNPVLDKDFFLLPSDAGRQPAVAARLPMSPDMDQERLDMLQQSIGGPPHHSFAARHADKNRVPPPDDASQTATVAPNASTAAYTLAEYLASKIEPIRPLRLVVDMVGSAEVVLVWNEFQLEQQRAGVGNSSDSLFGQEYRLCLRWSPLPHHQGAASAPHALRNEPQVSSRDFFFRCSDAANRLRLSNLNENFAHTASISVFDKHFHRWTQWSEPVRFTVTSRLELTLAAVTPGGFGVAWHRRQTTVDPRAIGNPIAPAKYEVHVERRSWSSLMIASPAQGSSRMASAASLGQGTHGNSAANSFAMVLEQPPGPSEASGCRAVMAELGRERGDEQPGQEPQDGATSRPHREASAHQRLEHVWATSADPTQSTFHTIYAAPASGCHVPFLALGCYRCRVRPHYAYDAIGPWSDAAYVAITPLQVCIPTLRQSTCDALWTVAAAAAATAPDGTATINRQHRHNRLVKQTILAQLTCHEVRQADDDRDRVGEAPSRSASGSTGTASTTTTRYFEIPCLIKKGDHASLAATGSYRCDGLAAGATYTLRGTVVSTELPEALLQLLAAVAPSCSIEGGGAGSRDGELGAVGVVDGCSTSDQLHDRPREMSASPAPSILRSRITRAMSKFPLLAAARLKAQTTSASSLSYSGSTSGDVGGVLRRSSLCAAQDDGTRVATMVLDASHPVTFTTLPMIDTVRVVSVGAKDAVVAWNRVLLPVPPHVGGTTVPPPQPPTDAPAAAAEEVYTVVVMNVSTGDIVAVTTVTPTSRPVSSLRPVLSKRIGGLTPSHRYQAAVVPYRLLLQMMPPNHTDNTTTDSEASSATAIEYVREHMFGDRSFMFSVAFSTTSRLEIFWRLTALPTGGSSKNIDSTTSVLGSLDIFVTRCAGPEANQPNNARITEAMRQAARDGGGVERIALPRVATGCRRLLGLDKLSERAAFDEPDSNVPPTSEEDFLCYLGDGGDDGGVVTSVSSPLVTEISVTLTQRRAAATEMGTEEEDVDDDRGKVGTLLEDDGRKHHAHDEGETGACLTSHREQRVLRRRFKASGVGISRVTIPLVQRGTRFVIVVRQKDFEGQWDDDAWRKATIVM